MKKKILNLISIMLLCFVLAGCSSFFGSNEALQIENIQAENLENGDIKITITYVDEVSEPTIFIVPKGDKGSTGVGIKEITTIKKDDGSGSILTITYTDDSISPTIVEVKDGISVSSIDPVVNPETGEIVIYIRYSDGTSSEPMLLPKGEDGKDGISVIGIDQRINRDSSVTLTFKMSQGEDVIVNIPAPQQGEDGRGIQDIVSIPNGDRYVMIITYTDDTTKELEFARPNKWFSEMSKPLDTDGINGDLWYDLSHNVIYVKQNNKWTQVINLYDTTNKTYTVKFDLNDSTDAPANMPLGTLFTYEMVGGNYFKASGYEIPIPTREGYVFAGWYTVKIPTVVNGAFTDLTAVFSDLTLYAKWELANA